ncbi:MAG: biopolymer transporter ExbD [Chitinophagales bacterium]
MAQIDNSNSNGKSAKMHSRKTSVLIDMTPMVDLGFLLISFFMLTTALTKPVAMDLTMPVKSQPRDIEASKVLNIICDKDNKIWYYNGYTLAGLKATDYTAEGIRKVILNKQKEVDKKWDKDASGNTQMICLIKLKDDANYNNMIDVLDEMDITETKIYAIQEVNELEKEAISNKANIAMQSTY